jgi:hypothetical protein
VSRTIVVPGVLRATGALVLASALLAVLPEVAMACPVCFSASDENREAFLATTAFLSLLPLGMVAGAGFWMRRRSREIDAEELSVPDRTID